ncbi:MAG: aldehyde dehydrogenase [Saprospiraceae bacterium]|nr:aldehyde dehydrogenase [Saprospiraceae bacterium]
MSIVESPVSKVEEIFHKQAAFFHTGKTKDIAFRKQSLKQLFQVLKANESMLNAAIYEDFKKGEFETYVTEIGLIYKELKYFMKHVERWALPSAVPTNLANMPGKSWISPEPFGTSLIIGAWNYPYELTLGPLIPAIAAGNTAVLKPSELAPNASAAMAEVINKHFDPQHIAVQEGAVAEAQALLNQPFDKIFFTGSTQVGKIVMKAAAEHLSHVTLELGGKSPCFVLPDANITLAAKRIVWGKFLNAGQTCIAPDYLLVHESVKAKLVTALKTEIQALHGDNPEESEALIRIINDRHFQRLHQLIDPEKVIFGGQTNPSTRYIAPTLMDHVTWDDAIMQEEIFGPILPILTYSDLSNAKQAVRKLSKPLAFYVFSRSARTAKELTQDMSFGGCTINDTLMHFTNPALPFGGVGASGMGSYHGKAGFACFSNYKSILKKATWFEPFMRYAPYTPFKKKLMKWALE